MHRSWMLAVPLLAVLWAASGCGCTAEPSKPATPTAGNGDSGGPTESKGSSPADSGAEGQKTASEEPKPFKLGDLIEPFTPPKLEELDKTADWQDRPVLDSLKLLREKLAKEMPLVTVQQALAMKNDSESDNEKIKSALGRLHESDNEVNWDAEINRHAYGDVNSINPILSSSVVESEVTGLMGFGLFSFDWEFNPFASSDTVESWQTSKDGMLDKVVMRKDLTWSDGKPITAHDVAFSFKAIMTSAIPVPAQRSGTDKLKWVEAYDDHTLVYFQKQPYATNVWNLNFSIIPQHIYEAKLPDDPTLVNDPYFVKLENDPVVGGSYIIKSRTRGQEIVLERRDDYYMHEGKQVRDKPYFKTIRFRIRPDLSVALLALKAGDIDEMQLAPEMWRNQTSDDDYYRTNTKASAIEWTEFHFVWNLKDPLFSDKRVRTAMSYAMDYEELIKRLRYGLDEQCGGVFHPTAKWAPKPAPKLFVQDLEKAEQLLDEAGWTDSDGDGVRDKMVGGRKVDFRFSMLTVNKQDRVDICTLMKECLDQIGVKCDVKPLEFAVVIALLQNKKFQATFGGWGTGADPYTLENIFKTGEERNYGSYSSAKVDELFEAGMRELDPEKRVKIYQQISLILSEDQPYTWLFHQNAFYGFNKSLRGYNFSPRGPYSYGPGFGAIWKPAAL
ncbi:MAG: ABC transporter substrate-binding protein [Planctomycetaceae bacterium]|nr:ABC transporter substrate-binding protein [Planctomycetaceae bacterium]